MELDARQLAGFYESGLGAVARRLLLRRLRQVWPAGDGLRFLGFGYALPYLRPFLPEAERAVVAMPARMGVRAWPGRPDSQAKCLSCLVDEQALPFPDAFFDRVLVVHGLEGAESLRLLLRQLWRVLAPEGRMLILVPNRASLWAQVEVSPFGCGRPFSRRELESILRAGLFVPERWERALYAPPLHNRALIGTGAAWERFGRRFFPGLGGVFLVEVSKSLYAPVGPAPAPVQAARLNAVRQDGASLRTRNTALSANKLGPA